MNADHEYSYFRLSSSILSWHLGNVSEACKTGKGLAQMPPVLTMVLEEEADVCSIWLAITIY